MTGEMSQFDADHDEEWATHRAVAKAIKGRVRAFDVYQGPYIQPKEGGRLWLSSDDGGAVTPVWERAGRMIEGEPCLWDDEEGIIAMSRDVIGGVYKEVEK